MSMPEPARRPAEHRRVRREDGADLRDPFLQAEEPRSASSIRETGRRLLIPWGRTRRLWIVSITSLQA